MQIFLLVSFKCVIYRSIHHFVNRFDIWSYISLVDLIFPFPSSLNSYLPFFTHTNVEMIIWSFERICKDRFYLFCAGDDIYGRYFLSIVCFVWVWNMDWKLLPLLPINLFLIFLLHLGLYVVIGSTLCI